MIGPGIHWKKKGKRSQNGRVPLTDRLIKRRTLGRIERGSFARRLDPVGKKRMRTTSQTRNQAGSLFYRRCYPLVFFACSPDSNLSLPLLRLFHRWDTNDRPADQATQQTITTHLAAGKNKELRIEDSGCVVEA